MTNIADQFRDAMRAAGLEPPTSIVVDGKIHRFASNGKRGDDAGWYVLNGDAIPAGAFGCWRTGVSETWRVDSGRELPAAEERAYRAKVESKQRAREAAVKRHWAEARRSG